MILRHRLKALLASLALVAAVLTLVAAAAATMTAPPGTRRRVRRRRPTLTIVGYSVAREVYADVIPAFQATPAGEGTSFKESYGASGDQSRAVEAGLDADYVAFSLEPDIDPPGGRRPGRRRLERRPARRASSATRSWSSSCARATRRASRPGTT